MKKAKLEKGRMPTFILYSDSLKTEFGWEFDYLQKQFIVDVNLCIFKVYSHFVKGKPNLEEATSSHIKH